MPEYKLYYFHMRGRAEPVRLCFAAAGVKYEDIRFTREEWQEKKKEGFSLTGALPMLEVDGKKLYESMAIMRYVSRECGLSPSDSFEVAQCDMIVNMTYDLFPKIVQFLYEKDEEEKKVLIDEFNGTHVPKFMTCANSLLKGNNGGQGFFVGSKLSYADIIIFFILDHMEMMKKVLCAYPELKAHFQHIGEIPAIKTWIETRPKTEI